ncbi:hypothetical protein K435DRAFT_807101 [Dendrothele bispora CBS 962.96]|uniref:Uncharacterized protein n=1 Tax=Dendrothele bispora (strain CBS 962.96) TaxID=1314807 RepID=A0A4S8L5T8_DENBC|nr:hypothetical protein K435DRAFT_807101 [Dendrothele bispora CBS 962.96]
MDPEDKENTPLSTVSSTAAPPEKRCPGRPKGSKNKPKDPNATPKQKKTTKAPASKKKARKQKAAPNQAESAGNDNVNDVSPTVLPSLPQSSIPALSSSLPAQPARANYSDDDDKTLMQSDYQKCQIWSKRKKKVAIKGMLGSQLQLQLTAQDYLFWQLFDEILVCVCINQNNFSVDV